MQSNKHDIVQSTAANGTELNQRLNSQKTPHTSPSWANYGVFCEDLRESLPCNNGTALYLHKHSQCLKLMVAPGDQKLGWTS